MDRKKAIMLAIDERNEKSKNDKKSVQDRMNNQNA